MALRIDIHNRKVEFRRKNIGNWKIPAEDRRAMLRFLDDLAIGRVNLGHRISESRQTKYLDVLRVPLEFFGKSVNRLTVKDIERFERALTGGDIISNRGKSYSHATMVDIRTALRTFLRWRLGKEKAQKLAGWLDTREVKKTPDFLHESQVLKLFKACRTAEDRFAIAVLFDSGARAGEFHNIRFEDVQLPEGKRNYVKLTLKEEYSKTKGRTISLFWGPSADAIRDYVQQRLREGIRTDEPVFKKTYSATRLLLHRLGMKVLQRPVHYHLFRHSSATYYADKMNRQQLCIRYGWTFSSDMPDIYISRAGVEMAELDEKFSSTELSDMQQQFDAFRREAALKFERLDRFEAVLRIVARDFPTSAAALALDPSESVVEKAIKRRAA